MTARCTGWRVRRRRGSRRRAGASSRSGWMPRSRGPSRRRWSEIFLNHRILTIRTHYPPHGEATEQSGQYGQEKILDPHIQDFCYLSLPSRSPCFGNIQCSFVHSALGFVAALSDQCHDFLTEGRLRDDVTRLFVVRAWQGGIRNFERDSSHCLEPISFVLPPSIHLYGNMSVLPPSSH